MDNELLVGLVLAMAVLSVGCDGDAGGDDAGMDARVTGADAGRGCLENRDCRGGELCQDGICREACGTDDPCATPGTICEGGICVPGCTESADCAGGQVCEDGQCVQICEGDGDCAGGEACVGARCVEIGTDSGPNPLDAGPNDGGPNPVDGGPSPVDGGPNPVDGGPNPVDGGPAPVDSGPPLVDSGPPPVDAGTDSGPPDAGTSCLTTGCPVTQRCCGVGCVNREVPVGTDGRGDSSFQHCGGCDTACNIDRASACSRPSGAIRCMCGNMNACVPGEVCVPSSGGAGGFTCTDLRNDPDNCGEVGNVCGLGESCIASECRCGVNPACSASQACCSETCVDVSSDTDNCGGCGAACGGYGDRCIGGECRCGAGGDTCVLPATGVGLGELCCAGACVDQTDSNCATCGAMCAVGSSCIVDSFFSGTCCAASGFPICGFGG